ncbi:hypothetical protein ATE48_08515 [Candidatus Viadribacter manganicus]|uniref:Uncharacterized protein n=1 Tax=Candidatus Viadribacter manganicus TaxID=1759059 RepID=A0A1B1AHB3_9PROT|nr:hypothetical protein ATE48_08515 [Candidatus Viadribacter manganicus]
MFAQEILLVTARWARSQLRFEPKTSAKRRQLRQLIAAAEALRRQLPSESELPANVLRLSEYRCTSPPITREERAHKFRRFLDE